MVEKPQVLSPIGKYPVDDVSFDFN